MVKPIHSFSLKWQPYCLLFIYLVIIKSFLNWAVRFNCTSKLAIEHVEIVYRASDRVCDADILSHKHCVPAVTSCKLKMAGRRSTVFGPFHACWWKKFDPLVTATFFVFFWCHMFEISLVCYNCKMVILHFLHRCVYGQGRSDRKIKKNRELSFARSWKTCIKCNFDLWIAVMQNILSMFCNSTISENSSTIRWSKVLITLTRSLSFSSAKCCLSEGFTGTKGQKPIMFDYLFICPYHVAWLALQYIQLGSVLRVNSVYVSLQSRQHACLPHSISQWGIYIYNLPIHHSV